MLSKYPRSMAGLFLAAMGLLTLSLSAFRVVPMRFIAERVSGDGALSPIYADTFVESQVAFGCALLAAAILFAWIRTDVVATAILRYSDRRFFSLVGGAVGLAAFLIQELVFEGIPHVTDAISHLFQAKLFASGLFYAALPPCPDAFYQYHVLMTTTGKWFTKYTPGHALLLAGGLRAGLERIVLPACTAGVAVLLGRLVSHFDKPLIGRFCSLFIGFSPLALLLGGSYMSHTTAMFCSLIGIFFLVRCATQAPVPLSWKAGVLSGFFLGYAALIRPHEFLMLGLIGALYVLMFSPSSLRAVVLRMPFLLVGLSLPAAIWVVYNMNVYGRPFVLGYGFSSDQVLHPAFQGQFGLSEMFGWGDALAVFVWNLERTNGSLLGWPITWLVLPFGLFSRGPRRMVGLAALGTVVVIGTYFFYDYRSEFEGRYYYGALPFLVYLSAKALQRFSHLTGKGDCQTWNRQIVMLTVMAFAVYGLTYYWPRYLVPRYRHAYESADARLAPQLTKDLIRPCVVLVDAADGDPFLYSSVFLCNDPELKNDVIYARFSADNARCLQVAFPGRNLYRVLAGLPDEAGLRTIRLTPLGLPNQ